MKKRITFILIFISIFLNSCATTSQNVSSGDIKIGMSKDDFCTASVTFRSGEDPCNKPLFSLSLEAPGIYYPSTKMEIMHSTKKDYFFVFQNVNTPFDYTTFKEGDGFLKKIFKNFDEAKKFASGGNKLLIKQNNIDKAKQICSQKGMVNGTEEFADCSLSELKKLSK